ASFPLQPAFDRLRRFPLRLAPLSPPNRKLFERRALGPPRSTAQSLTQIAVCVDNAASRALAANEALSAGFAQAKERTQPPCVANPHPVCLWLPARSCRPKRFEQRPSARARRRSDEFRCSRNVSAHQAFRPDELLSLLHPRLSQDESPFVSIHGVAS